MENKRIEELEKEITMLIDNMNTLAFKIIDQQTEISNLKLRMEEMNNSLV